MPENPWVAAAARSGPQPQSGKETTGTTGRDAASVEDPASTTPPVPAAESAPPPVTGAHIPQANIDAPGPGGGALPVRMVRPTASLWVVGAHGGAGESSLATLDTSWEATDHAWPTPSDVSGRCHAVLVARTSATGLRRAQRALTQWASGVLGPATTLHGLVLVADAPGRLPKALRELAVHVAGGAPRTWNVGWVEAWRLGEVLTEEDTPKPLRQLVSDLHVLSGATRSEDNPPSR